MKRHLSCWKKSNLRGRTFSDDTVFRKGTLGKFIIFIRNDNTRIFICQVIFAIFFKNFGGNLYKIAKNARLLCDIGDGRFVFSMPLKWINQKNALSPFRDDRAIHFSSLNFRSRYGSISRTVAMLNSSSKEIPRFILGASTDARCWRLMSSISASCSWDSPFAFR